MKKMTTEIAQTRKKVIAIVLVIAGLIMTLASQAQTSYTIGSSANWSAKLPTTCYACTINVSSGATLTIDKSVTCQNCEFVGGTVSMTNYTLNIQYAGSQTTTIFNGTNLTVYGDNAKVVVNAPLSLTNAVFTFYNASYFNTSYQVDLVSSKVVLSDNSSMYSTGGSSTFINLSKSSQIVIGNGSQTSKSIFAVSGPTLNLYDKSGVALGNSNNVFYDWSNYTGSPNTNSNSAAQHSYSSSAAGVTMNCGGSYPHSCQAPYLYGPATLSTSGTVSGSVLPVVLVGFTAELETVGTVVLNWNTAQEVNASHFDIERSADGNSWATIGTVQAIGNSRVASDYSYTDQRSAAGVNYYRLKMVDLDGRYGYTDVKVVRNGSLVNKVSFFPNPARDYVNVGLGGATGIQVTVRLMNQSGQVLQEKTAEAGNGVTVTMPLQQYASGMYVLSVVAADGTRETSKLVISKF